MRKSLLTRFHPFILLTLVTILLSACQGNVPIAASTPEATNTLASTDTPAPTETSVPTATDSAPPTTERAYADRPDDFPGEYQVHILYLLPAGANDLQRDLDGNINKSVNELNEWFLKQSDGSKIRFDTYQGELDITFLQMDMTSTGFYDAAVAKYGGPYWIRDIVEEELSKTNTFQPGKIYLAMLEIAKVPSACADAAHPPDLMGRLANLYPSAVVEAGWDCADWPIGETLTTSMDAIHEIVHLLGFASSCGNNPTSLDNLSHTGDFNDDLMWAPETGSTEQWDIENMKLDPGNDDYFMHNIPNCPDLAKSVFLDPNPANAETPLGWPAEWQLP